MGNYTIKCFFVLNSKKGYYLKVSTSLMWFRCWISSQVKKELFFKVGSWLLIVVSSWNKVMYMSMMTLRNCWTDFKKSKMTTSGRNVHSLNFVVFSSQKRKAHFPPDNLARHRMPCSSYSLRVIQKFGLSFIKSAKTEPPKKTMCLRRGGDSTAHLNFLYWSTFPWNTFLNL